MNSIISCESLFPCEKGDFDSEHFQELIKNNPCFLEWLKRSFTSAYIQLNRIDCAMSKRLRSSNIHEFVFAKLADNLIDYLDLSNKVSFITSSTGNQRNFFTFDKYIFILHKEDASTNNTSVTDLIRNQNAPAHIITIEYAVSIMHDSIISLSLAYHLGKSAKFFMNVPLSPSVEENSVDNVQEVVATKPRFSRKVLGEKSVG